MKQKINISTPLYVLFLEDTPKDAEVCRELIIDSGYNLDMDITATEKEFESFLCSRKYDVILSDFKLPGFDAFGALRLCNKICPDVPFICVSGAIGEETAVELLKLGAVDYILKDRLERLPFAIKSAIDDVKEKKSRHKAEILLAASEMQYRRLFESAQDGIFILNVETGKIVDVNPFLIELLGYSKEEFLEKEIWEIGFFKNIVANKDKYLELLNKKYVRYEDLPLEKSDGRKINVEFVSNVYSVNSHKVIQCNIRDITERKKIEQKSKDNEKRFRAIIDQAPIAVALLDMQGHPIISNLSLSKMVGYSNDELSKMKFTEFTYQEDVDKDMNQFIDLINGKISKYSMEKRFVHKNGNLVWVNLSVTMLRDENGNGQEIIGMAEDITERKLIEESLRESEERFRMLYENAKIGLYRTTIDGTVLMANKQLVKMLGYPSFEVLAERNLEKEGFEPSYQRKGFLERIEKDGEINNYESAWVRRDGKVVFVSESAKAIRDTNNSILYIDGVVEDITERKLAEEEMKLKLKELQAWYDVSINREERIIELKNEINLLLKSLGQKEKYKLE